MRHEEAIRLLDDYLDGELTAARAVELERHLAGCDACRKEVADLRRLLAAAAELPADLPPTGDLWPDIARRLDGPAARPTAASRPVASGARRRPVRSLRRPALAMAAVLVLAVLSVAVVRLAGPSRDGSGRGPADLSLPAALALECELPAVARTPGAAGEPVPPGVQALIDGDLAIIDRAIAELDEAVAADPDNAHLMRMLAAVYRTRASLLAQETGLARRS